MRITQRVVCSPKTSPGAMRVSRPRWPWRTLDETDATQSGTDCRQAARCRWHARGRTIGEVCQALGISEPTFQRWRQQYGGMKAEEAKRLKELEEENKRLKKLLAEAELDKAILKEALEGN